jgi:proline dehydrogenase
MKLVLSLTWKKEHARAKQKGYPTPICASKEATDANYATVDFI